MLQEQVEELRGNIAEQREVNKARALQQQATLQTLEIELTNRKQEADSARSTLNHCQEVIDRLLDGIHRAFQLLIHDTNPVLELLGEKPLRTLESRDVLVILGIVAMARSYGLSLFNTIK